MPRQYDPAKPACLYVGQDGVQFNGPAVFDELIDWQRMPITIGVFVMHGRVKGPNGQAIDRFNRSFEYDGLGASYARFLTDELLPEFEKKKTSDGRPIRISKDPNDRAIGAPAAERFAPSPPPGSGPILFAAFLARSALTSVSAVETNIPR